MGVVPTGETLHAPTHSGDTLPHNHKTTTAVQPTGGKIRRVMRSSFHKAVVLSGQSDSPANSITPLSVARPSSPSGGSRHSGFSRDSLRDLRQGLGHRSATATKLLRQHSSSSSIRPTSQHSGSVVVVPPLDLSTEGVSSSTHSRAKVGPRLSSPSSSISGASSSSSPQGTGPESSVSNAQDAVLPFHHGSSGAPTVGAQGRIKSSTLRDPSPFPTTGMSQEHRPSSSCGSDASSMVVENEDEMENQDTLPPFTNGSHPHLGVHSGSVHQQGLGRSSSAAPGCLFPVRQCRKDRPEDLRKVARNTLGSSADINYGDNVAKDTTEPATVARPFAPVAGAIPRGFSSNGPSLRHGLRTPSPGTWNPSTGGHSEVSHNMPGDGMDLGTASLQPQPPDLSSTGVGIPVSESLLRKTSKRWETWRPGDLATRTVSRDTR